MLFSVSNSCKTDAGHHTLGAYPTSVITHRQAVAAGTDARRCYGTAQKPEAALSITLRTAPVGSIALWLRASRHPLEDFPALEDFHRSALMRVWKRKVEISF
jgi:hypothetical protein